MSAPHRGTRNGVHSQQPVAASVQVTGPLPAPVSAVHARPEPSLERWAAAHARRLSRSASTSATAVPGRAFLGGMRPATDSSSA